MNSLTDQVIFDVAGALNTFKVFITIDNSLDLQYLLSSNLTHIPPMPKNLVLDARGGQKPGFYENYSL
jgi:hypothetical protein